MWWIIVLCILITNALCVGAILYLVDQIEEKKDKNRNFGDSMEDLGPGGFIVLCILSPLILISVLGYHGLKSLKTKGE